MYTLHPPLVRLRDSPSLAVKCIVTAEVPNIEIETSGIVAAKHLRSLRTARIRSIKVPGVIVVVDECVDIEITATGGFSCVMTHLTRRTVGVLQYRA